MICATLLSAMPASRIAKTLDRLRARALPPSTWAVRALTTGGARTACSGCGEVIEALETAYYVRVSGADTVRFHPVCYETWMRFRQPAA